jgi:transposase
MLNFPPSGCIWLATAPVDLRRSFDRLAAEVRDQLHNDPLSGHIFVFKNKRGDRVKLLYWDEDGYVIVYKRLELGVFSWPVVAARAGMANNTARAVPRRLRVRVRAACCSPLSQESGRELNADNALRDGRAAASQTPRRQPRRHEAARAGPPRFFLASLSHRDSNVG